MQTLIIKGRLAGYNELQAHHFTSYKLKKSEMERVGWLCKAQGIKPVEGKARVEIICYEPNKMRDPSNVRSGAEKIILDALQNMKIIKNDNWKWLKDTPTAVELDRKDPRIEVILTECEE